MADAARTAAACRIARLDRQKFNDLMASGDYDCAPRTSPGVPRVFEMPDLIGLFVFARLTERGRTARQAGEIACRIVSQLWNERNADKPEPSHVAIAYGVNGGSFTCTATPDDVNAFASQASGLVILNTEVWNVANARAEIVRGLAEENRVVGED